MKIQLSFRRFFVHPTVILILGLTWLIGTRFISGKFDELIVHAFSEGHFYIHTSQNGTVEFSCRCDPDNSILFDSAEEAFDLQELNQKGALFTLNHIPLLNQINLKKYGDGLSFFFMGVSLVGNVLFCMGFCD